MKLPPKGRGGAGTCGVNQPNVFWRRAGRQRPSDGGGSFRPWRLGGFARVARFVGAGPDHPTIRTTIFQIVNRWKACILIAGVMPLNVRQGGRSIASLMTILRHHSKGREGIGWILGDG